MNETSITRLAFAVLLGACLGAAGCKSASADNHMDLGGGQPVHTVTYFAGTGSVTSLMDGSTHQEMLIMTRTVDSTTSMISEIACSKPPGQAAMLSPVYMRVAADNTLKIADVQDVDHPNALQGTGTVAGTAWSWNYLTFDMTFQGGIKIKDANFFVSGGTLGLARKQLFLPTGAPLELYDVSMSAVDQATYQAQANTMGCPAS